MTPIPLTPPAPLTPEALADLTRSCHADSVAAGWWDPLGAPTAEIAREAVRADLIASEVGEALDALRRPERPLAYLDDKGKPDGYLVEVADTAIRACDLLGRILSREDRRLARVAAANVSGGLYLTKWQHLVLYQVVRLAHNDADYGMTLVRVEASIRRLTEIVYLCAEETTRHGADLVALINLKRAYNRTRGKRHGGLSV